MYTGGGVLIVETSHRTCLLSETKGGGEGLNVSGSGGLSGKGGHGAARICYI